MNKEEAFEQIRKLFNSSPLRKERLSVKDVKEALWIMPPRDVALELVSITDLLVDMWDIIKEVEE